ncbi:uncharacterized protein LOC105695415 [Orussus abietinus]|uniref:uncharacterized protein LOC105695415 n=1 Tax=Orussus abietinus TaxID=222816 RepID=UPI000625CC6F|nr:uncharacterized protein LOC105695415 [Orussus abietinus]
MANLNPPQAVPAFESAEIIKQLLLSRYASEQDEAVQYIINDLKHATEEIRPLVVQNLFKLDLITNLCNVLESSSGQTLRSILNTLEILVDYAEFYSHRHQTIARNAYGYQNRIDNRVQILEILKSLIPWNSTNELVKISCAEILCLIMSFPVPGIDNNKGFLSSLLVVFEESLKTMCSFFNDNDNVTNAIQKLSIICEICASGTLFCTVEEDIVEREILSSELENIGNAEQRATFTKLIYDAVTEVLVPFVKTVAGKVEKLQQYMVKCLNDLYQLEDCLTTKLSICLIENGYLKYFLDATITASTLDMIELEPLIKRLLITSEDILQSGPVLKALWFLFAISTLSHVAPFELNEHAKAAENLNTMLLNVDLKQYYTHHPGLLFYSFQDREVTDELRIELVGLWLEFDGDVEVVITADQVNAKCRCLLELVRRGTRKQVLAAMKGLKILLAEDKYTEEISGTIWEMVPLVLASYTNNDDNVMGLLEIANVAKPKITSNTSLRRTSLLLIKMIMKENLDVQLIITVIRHAYVVLVHSITKDEQAIMLMYVKEPELLIKLRIFGFDKENSDLSAASLTCLSFILCCQYSFSIQSADEPIIIKMEELLEHMWGSNLKRQPTIHVLRFTFALLSYKIEKPVVTLAKFSSDPESLKTIRIYYNLLHTIHGKSDMTVKDVVYRCFCGFLDYCHENHVGLLKILIQQPWTNVLVQLTVNLKAITKWLTKFLVTWMKYRKQYLPEYLVIFGEGADTNRALCRDRFEQTLDVLDNFLKTGRERDTQSKENLDEIERALNIFRIH